MQRLGALIRGGLPGGVILHGAAGVGKSRLLGEFVSDVAASGWDVERISGSVSTASLPLGALGALLPEPIEAAQGIPFQQRLRDHFVSRDGPRLLVAVDDVHSLDPASALFLAQLADRGYFFLAASARSEERWPATVEGLVKDRVVEPFEIHSLDDDSIQRLIRSAVDGPVDPPTLARITTIVDGNPLFLRELVEHCLETGALICRDGYWMLDGEPSISATLRRIAADRLGTLDSERRHGLEALALAQPLELDTMLHFLSAPAVTDLERRHIVAVETSGNRRTVSFVHPLVAEVVVNNMPVMQRRSLAGRLAEVVSARGARRRGDPLRLGMWHLEGGAGIDAATLALAADQAHSAADHALAERLARAAIDAGAGVDAQITMADSMSRQGQIGAAEALFARLVEGASDPVSRARIALLRAENVGIRGSDLDRGLEILDSAMQGADPSAASMLLGHQALLLAFKPDVPRARAAAERLAAHPALPPAVAAAALTHVEMLQLWQCDLDGARASVARATALVEDADVDPDVLDRLSLGPLIADSLDGELDRSIARAKEHYRQAVTLPITDYAGLWAMWLCYPLRLSGALTTAVDVGMSARRLIRRVDPTGVHGGVLGFFGTALAEIEARAELDVVIAELGDGVATPPPRAMWLEWLLGWRASLDGDAAGASDHLRSAAEAAFDDGVLISAVWVVADAVRLGDFGWAVESTARVARATSAGFVERVARYAAAKSEADPKELEVVAREHTELGEYLHAICAYRDAAAQHHRSGHHTDAARAVTTGRHLAASKSEVPVTLLGDLPRYLTARETQIARIAATGVTSREIGARLHISVRTVDNHLASVYTKLGIHGRDELAGTFGTTP